MKKQVIHTVPNFSEGRDAKKIKAISGVFKDKKGVKLIGVFPDADFNRTVIDAIGYPEPLVEVLMEMSEKSYGLISMEKHEGRHPRIGAQDTIPLFPLKNISMPELMEIAEKLAKLIFAKFQVPVYFSGQNARSPERKELSFIRQGQYEGLKKLVHTPERAPDLGTGLHPTAGATIVSADTVAITAVNIVLDSNSLELAQKIAQVVRGPSGGFSSIRAVGFILKDKQKSAVSMNMFDTQATPIYRVLRVVEDEAKRFNTRVLGTQIVGPVSNDCLINCAEHYLRLVDFSPNQIIESHLMDL